VRREQFALGGHSMWNASSSRTVLTKFKNSMRQSRLLVRTEQALAHSPVHLDDHCFATFT